MRTLQSALKVDSALEAPLPNALDVALEPLCRALLTRSAPMLDPSCRMHSVRCCVSVCPLSLLSLQLSEGRATARVRYADYHAFTGSSLEETG